MTKIRCSDVLFILFSVILCLGYALYLGYEYPRGQIITLQSGQRVELHYLNLRYEPPPHFTLKRPLDIERSGENINHEMAFQFITQDYVSGIQRKAYGGDFTCFDCPQAIGWQKITFKIVSVGKHLTGKQALIHPYSRILQTSVFRTPMRWENIQKRSFHIYGVLSLLQPYPIWLGIWLIWAIYFFRQHSFQFKQRIKP